MDYVVEELEGFKVIGFLKDFSFENSYQEIPKFWNEINSKYHSRIYPGQNSAKALEQAIINNRIGEFGICIDEAQKPNTFQYMIAGNYQGGPVPEGLKVFELPKMTWAKFKCVGPMPNALQEVNTRIFKEWLPGNKEYEIGGRYNIEWYSSEGDMQSNEYQSEIWIPVKKK
ncbi:MAG: GyrI-like domain-containing protein [Prevotella sp.]|nr:GyrI-like domain-containing protein [Staphylococcus sp.]MCM1349583.1 GyrI-like domain-containing protein [Prevotella sp.]